VGDKNL